MSARSSVFFHSDVATAAEDMARELRDFGLDDFEEEALAKELERAAFCWFDRKDNGGPDAG